MYRLCTTLFILFTLTACAVYPVIDTSIPANQAIVEARRTAAPELTLVPVVVPGLVPAQVTNVVDGDTIDVEIDGAEYRVRYILIDTPERGMPYFAESTAANRALVEGQTVYLVKDVSETDRYGRLLRYVYLADGTFVNEELVRQGFAQIATFPPDVAMEAVIRDAQAEAVAQGRGLWAGESLPTPELCTVKGNVSATGQKIAHVEGQANYLTVIIDPDHGEKCFPTLEAAIAEGWRAAQR